MFLAPLVVLAISAPPQGHWCRDETGKVSSSALAQFDATAQALDDSGEGQLGLAVVASTHGENPRAFATRVFNAWGVGHAGRNDGVLLFFALDDRKSEIVHGDRVVANMKAGRLDDAVTQAAAALAAFVSGSFAGVAPAAPVPLPEFKEKSPRGWVVDVGFTLTPEEEAAFDRVGDAVYASGKGLLFVAPYSGGLPVAKLAAALRQKLAREDAWVVFGAVPGGAVDVEVPGAKRIFDEYDRACRSIESAANGKMSVDRTASLQALLEAMQATAPLVMNGPPPVPIDEVVTQAAAAHPVASFGGLGGAGLLGFVSLRSWLRRRPRNCKGCGNLRHRLSEEADDPHLSAGQRAEEQLGSVDYDVWWCGRCNDALVLRYGTIFTRYSRCRSCDHKTSSSSSVTLVHATYDHGGTVEVTESCQFCNHVHRYTRHTARLTRSDSSSSSSSSFGGGSSSGGGSSGSW